MKNKSSAYIERPSFLKGSVVEVDSESDHVHSEFDQERSVRFLYTSNIHEQTLARPLRVRVQHSYIHLNGNFKRASLRSGSCKSNSLTTIENCHPQRSGIKKAFAWQVWQASTTGWMLSCMVHVCQPRPHGDGGARLIVTLLRNTSANNTISGQEPRWCTHAVYAKV